MNLAQAEVRVTAMRLETPDIVRCELQASDGGLLPPAEPGAHIDLGLPNGLTRPYSVVSQEEGAYVIAVRREAGSRGGSTYICDRLRIGELLRVGMPRNQFPLAEAAAHSVLIAGGIGITPLLPMARALQQQGREVVLHGVVRDITALPLKRELAALGPAFRLHATRDHGRPDLGALVQQAPAGSHFYCCGPASMLEDFTAATAGIPPDRVHVERFEAAAPAADAGSFDIELARSGRCLTVGPAQSVLDVLLDAGVSVAHSCCQGICGSCAIPVLGGTPAHRDEVLTEGERARNDTMMACCSRSLGGKLVLDL